MDFSLTEDHLALRDAVRRFCDGEYPAHERGNRETADVASRRWNAMAELGLAGLVVDTSLGGSAQGGVEQVLAAIELGRALAGAPFAPAQAAARLLERWGTPAQQDRWLPALARGELQVAIALDGAVQLREQAQGWTLAGEARLVDGGDRAQLLLVAAAVPGQPAHTLVALEAGTPGLQRDAFPTLDGRHAAHLRLDGVVVASGALVGPLQGMAEAMALAADAVAATQVAEAVGAMDAVLELTLEQLRTRKQFGSVLARFQALQHRAADMVIAVEQIKSMAYAAGMALDCDDAALRARIVRAGCLLAHAWGRDVAMEAIQMHGAMGMTDECRAGHYAKRLLVIGQRCAAHAAR